MSKFIVEAQYQDEAEPFRFGHIFSLDDREFLAQKLDVEEELFLAKDSLADIKSIEAAEDINDNVRQGDVVWRDWADMDLTSTEGRKTAIAVALGTKALWKDKGFGFDMFAEILCPEDWEIREYGLRAEDGYAIPG